MSDCGLQAQLPAVDYFVCLGLSRQLCLDEQVLEAHFYERQRQFHPDRFVSASMLDKRAAALTSANINEAFQTLKQPEKRVRYWLMLYGVDVNARVHLPANRLMQHLSWREQIEASLALADNSAKALHETLSQEHQGVWRDLLSLCEQLAAQTDDASIKQQALLAFHDVCFLNKCLSRFSEI